MPRSLASTPLVPFASPCPFVFEVCGFRCGDVRDEQKAKAVRLVRRCRSRCVLKRPDTGYTLHTCASPQQADAPIPHGHVRSKLKGPVLVVSEMSGLTVNHPPPARLWGSGNPVLWAGFPSAVGKSALRLFHCAASPQPFADRYLSKADPRRCSAPRHAAHSAGSAFHPGADARPPCNPLAWLASVLAGSVKSDFESSPDRKSVV